MEEVDVNRKRICEACGEENLSRTQENMNHYEGEDDCTETCWRSTATSWN
jgi:hypothetical protein